MMMVSVPAETSAGKSDPPENRTIQVKPGRIAANPLERSLHLPRPNRKGAFMRSRTLGIVGMLVLGACGGSASQSTDANFSEDVILTAGESLYCEAENENYFYAAVVDGIDEDRGGLIEFKQTATESGIYIVQGNATDYAADENGGVWESSSQNPQLLTKFDVANDLSSTLTRKGVEYQMQCEKADDGQPEAFRLAEALVYASEEMRGYGEAIIDDVNQNADEFGDASLMSDIASVGLVILYLPGTDEELLGEADESTREEYIAGESDPEASFESLQDNSHDIFFAPFWDISGGDDWGEYVSEATGDLRPVPAILESLQEGESMTYVVRNNVQIFDGIDGLSADETALEFQTGGRRFVVAGVAREK